MQDSGSGDQESCQRSADSGQQIAGSEAEGALPEAVNKGSAAGSEADNSDVNEVRDSELNEYSETEGKDHTGTAENCSADSSPNQVKQAPVDPATLNQLSNQFTRDEMVQMILDPEFVRRRPKLAAAFYYMIYGDSQFLEPWIKNSG